MRWDIKQETLNVLPWEDAKQWARIADALGVTVPTGPTAAQQKAWDERSQWYPPATAEQLDARDIQARLLPHRRKARNDFKVGAGLQPFPVYVAKFSDGTTQRLAAICKALNEGEIEAAMLMARAS